MEKIRRKIPNVFRWYLHLTLTFIMLLLAAPCTGHPQARAQNTEDGVGLPPDRQSRLVFAGGTGLTPSIAIGDDGLAVINYYDEDYYGINIAHCGNTGCSRDNTFTTVLSTDNRLNTAFAVGADGLPVFGYPMNQCNTLMIAHCGNPGCTAGNTYVVLDNAPLNYGFTELALTIGADGLPITVSRDISNVMKFAHCGTLDCSSGNTITPIDTPADFSPGNYQIAIGSDNLPLISYTYTRPGDSYPSVGVLHCGDLTCSNGNTFTRLSDTLGLDISLATGADGYPVFSYPGRSGGLEVAHCSDLTCASAIVTTTLDTYGTYSAITIGLDGLPIISYIGEVGWLKTVHCGDASCGSGNTIAILDKIGSRDPAITIAADGQPIISYNSYHDHISLRVAHCADPTCSSGAAITVIDSGGMPMQWSFFPVALQGFSGHTFTVLDSPLSSPWAKVAIGTDGLPIFTYFDTHLPGIKVAHCDRVDCTGSNQLTNLASSASMPSIAIGANGLPFLSYIETPTQKLRLYFCENPECTSGSLGPTLNVEGITSVMMGSDGLPLLSYNAEIDAGEDLWYEIKLIHCGDATCSSGNQTTTLAENFGYWIKLGSDGFPVILYFKDTRGQVPYDLEVIHCEDVACISHSTTTLRDAPDASKDFTGGLAIGADGLPVIGYIYFRENILKFIHCGDAACASGNTTVDLDTDIGHPSFAMGSDGFPLFAYLGLSGEIKILHCGDLTCTTGNTISVLDSNHSAEIELAIGADGLPILSYLHEATNDLIVAHCGDVACSTLQP